MRGYVAPISFGALLGVLAIITVVGVGASVVLHRTSLIPILIGIVLAVGVAYILLTVNPTDLEVPATAPTESDGRGASPQSTAPAPTTPAPPAPGPVAPIDPVDLEPGYDPVEEADRLESGT